MELWVFLLGRILVLIVLMGVGRTVRVQLVVVSRQWLDGVDGFYIVGVVG